MLYSQNFFDKMVEWIHVDVGKKLRSEIPDRDSMSSLSLSQQIIHNLKTQKPPPDGSKECQLSLMHDHKMYTLPMTLIIGTLASRDREISGTADRDPTCITLLSFKKILPLRGITNKTVHIRSRRRQTYTVEPLQK